MGAFLFQSPSGVGLTQQQWLEQRYDESWTFKEFRNAKIWIRLHWVGRYDKKLPAPYRHSHGIEVYNKVDIKESEWDEALIADKGWVLDVAATETFRTRSAADGAWENLLLRYADAKMEMNDDGEVILVEVGNELAGVGEDPGRLMRDTAQVEAAEEKGILVGGWS